ncbi:MAG: Pycsar system effector family protein [Chitinophagaceae bacterium]
MKYDDIIQKAADHVNQYCKTHHNLDLFYHDLSHAENVVTAVTEIANHYKLNPRDNFICLVSAWFHDIGYCTNAKEHEWIGAEEAAAFLNNEGLDKFVIDAVKNCILATTFPQRASNLLEQIVCDANLYHLGTSDFFLLSKKLHQEMESLHHIHISKSDWYKSTIQLFETHEYYTEYCKDLLNKGKKQNLEKLKKKLKKKTLETNPIEHLLDTYNHSTNGQAIPVTTEVPEQPERGTETLFRIASGISQRLNEQADTKAHILISVNSILISVLLALVVRKMDDYLYMIIPVVMFLSVNLLTIIFSVLSIRPIVSDGTFEQPDLDNKKINLLYFGNFYQMHFDDYANGLFQVIGDKHYLYLSLIRNLYDQGVVLGKKYKLLKAAYNIFMFGLVASVIAFVVASYLHEFH